MTEKNPGYVGREHCRYAGCARAATQFVTVDLPDTHEIWTRLERGDGENVPVCDEHGALLVAFYLVEPNGIRGPTH